MSDFEMPRFGYRPKPIRLMDTELKLDPSLAGQLGWSVQTDTGRVLSIDLAPPLDLDCALTWACSDFSRSMRLNPRLLQAHVRAVIVEGMIPNPGGETVKPLAGLLEG